MNILRFEKGTLLKVHGQNIFDVEFRQHKLLHLCVITVIRNTVIQVFHSKIFIFAPRFLVE